MFHAFNSFCDSDDEISYEIKEEKFFYDCYHEFMNYFINVRLYNILKGMKNDKTTNGERNS